LGFGRPEESFGTVPTASVLRATEITAYGKRVGALRLLGRSLSGFAAWRRLQAVHCMGKLDRELRRQKRGEDWGRLKMVGIVEGMA